MSKKDQYQFQGHLKNSKGDEINLQVDILQFEEEGVTYVYAPYLDIYGYGNNEDEARKSFKISLEEFFTSTKEKGTFVKELRRLGWKKKKQIFKPPKLNTSDPEIDDIISNHETTISKHEIPLPA